MTTEERLENLERELARVKRRNRWLLALGILLLGVTAAFAPEVIHHMARYPHRLESAVGVFVITVTGLSGLICVALSLVRLLGKKKGT